LFGGFSMDDNNGMKERGGICEGGTHFLNNIYVEWRFRPGFSYTLILLRLYFGELCVFSKERKHMN
jgi:hypothetical protein